MPEKTSDILSALVRQEHTVTLSTGEVTLRTPTPGKVVKIHAFLAKNRQGMSDEESAELSLRAHARALQACLSEEIDEDLAVQVICVSGGITGELGHTAMKLCGFKPIEVDSLPETDRPTS